MRKKIAHPALLPTPTQRSASLMTDIESQSGGDVPDFFTSVQSTLPPEPVSDAEKPDQLKGYLGYYKVLCERSRDAYNIHAVNLKNRHNLITFPLLIITSATGVIAGTNLPNTAGIIVGAASAVLTAVQRYCAYAERSENARMTAKSHAKIIRKIENMELIMDSKIVRTSNDLFSKFLREIQTEIDSTHENAKDVPWELLKYIDTIDANVCCVPVKGLPHPNKMSAGSNGS